MLKTTEYKLNSFLRKIVNEKTNGNLAQYAKIVGVTRNTINTYYNNKRRLGWILFCKFAEKSKYKISLKISNK